VGKWPNLRPTFDNVEWTSYEWNYQNLTIDVWDEEYEGGIICGPNKNTTCEYIIGVYGYCDVVSAERTSLDYDLIVTSVPTTVNILNHPQMTQQIEAHGSNSYGFCLTDTNHDVTIEFLQWSDACTCPFSYANLQVVVSHTKKEATMGDITWSIDHDAEYHTIVLRKDDPAVKTGTYYLNVLGWCTEDNECDDICTCAPCSNLVTTEYSIIVHNTTSLNYTRDFNEYLGSCLSTASSAIYSNNTCKETCVQSSVVTVNSVSSDDEHSLTTADTIGIVIAVVFTIGVSFFVAYYVFSRRKHTELLSTEEDQAIDRYEGGLSVAL